MKRKKQQPSIDVVDDDDGDENKVKNSGKLRQIWLAGGGEWEMFGNNLKWTEGEFKKKKQNSLVPVVIIKKNETKQNNWESQTPRSNFCTGGSYS